MWVRRVRRRLGRATVGDLLRPISLATYHHADLRAVARARGVHLGDLASRRHWLQPLTFTRVPILSFTAVEMEFPHAPRPTLRYVGPMIANQRIEPSTASPSVEKWQRYLADRESTGEGRRPIVYCSLGSYLTDVEFLRRVLGVFRERGEWHLVLGLGGMAAAQELGDVPDNATVLEWAPQLDVLSVADVAIIHGGSSSVHECIANAVPMLVYPPSRRDLDQHGNAARVEAAGLGIVGSWRSDGPTDIADRLDRLLSEESFRTRVRSMQEVFSTYGTHEVAVSTIARELRLHRSEAPGTEPPQGS